MCLNGTCWPSLGGTSELVMRCVLSLSTGCEEWPVYTVNLSTRVRPYLLLLKPTNKYTYRNVGESLSIDDIMTCLFIFRRVSLFSDTPTHMEIRRGCLG